MYIKRMLMLSAAVTFQGAAGHQAQLLTTPALSSRREWEGVSSCPREIFVNGHSLGLVVVHGLSCGTEAKPGLCPCTNVSLGRLETPSHPPVQDLVGVVSICACCPTASWKVTAENMSITSMCKFQSMRYMSLAVHASLLPVLAMRSWTIVTIDATVARPHQPGPAEENGKDSQDVPAGYPFMATIWARPQWHS